MASTHRLESGCEAASLRARWRVTRPAFIVLKMDIASLGHSKV